MTGRERSAGPEPREFEPPGDGARDVPREDALESSLRPSERDSVFIVIAAYNEEPKISEVVLELGQAFRHVVVVDDGSRDETGQRARAAGATLLTHAVNRGQGAALQTGISYALERGARVIVTFDADGQHSMDDVPALVRPILDGDTEICLGSRFLGSAASLPFGRRLLLWAARWFMRLAAGMPLTDVHNGFRAFSQKAALGIDIQLDRMAHASELIDQIRLSGLSFREVPVHVRYTDYSLAKGQRSSAALRVAFDYLIGKVLR